jgi:hypothetical protein
MGASLQRGSAMRGLVKENMIRTRARRSASCISTAIGISRSERLWPQIFAGVFYMSINEARKSALVGIRLANRTIGADFYCINIYNSESDRYLEFDGNIVITKDADLAPQLVGLLLQDECVISSVPTEPCLLCDLPETLRLIALENDDDRAIILNCLNVTFDLVAQAGCIIPEVAKRDLYKLADHLTFHQEFDTFLLAEGLKRDEMYNALCMCIGMILPHVFFIDKSRLLLYPWV